MKKVNKKYKELVDKATQKNVQKVTSGNGEPYLPRVRFMSKMLNSR